METNFARFQQLPNDLKKEILSHNASILHRSLPLNKQYYQLLLPIALKELGEKEISIDESGWFLNDNRVPLYTWIYIYENCMISTIRIEYPNHIDYAYYLVSITNNSSYQFVSEYNLDFIKNFNNGSHINTLIDVSTYYKIAKRRYSCVRANPNYAKILTHRYFDTAIKSLTGYDFRLYCYLVGHIWIFNFDLPIKNRKPIINIDDKGIPLPGEMNKSEIITVLKETEILIQKIRQMIDVLN